jgi:sphinganine-1-phosphate aldolase
MPQSTTRPLSLPSQGKPKEQVLAAMRAARDQDLKWREGRVFSLVYNAGDEVSNLLKEASELFFSENGLNPTAFPSLKKFETEVISMLLGLLGGSSQSSGTLTSGGTESILMAVFAAREWNRLHHAEITAPEIVLPSSAHPAFDKAAHYFSIRLVRVPVGPDFRADPTAMEASITPNTILIVGSAPSYPQGVVDPISELGQIALRHGLLMHVDACVGGLMLPFVRRLGYPVTPFDFQVPGVTSISADLHKYGYTAKGVSSILYRSAELRRCQFFATTDWPGGIYISPSLAGSRPGGPIASAWAVMHFLGEAGYLSLTQQVMQTAEKIRAGVKDIPGLQILGEPEMGVLALASDSLNIYEIADELDQLDWHLDRQQFPPCLHITLSPYHAQVVEHFLADLSLAAAKVRRPGLRKTAGAVLVSAANNAARWLPGRLVARASAVASFLVGGIKSGLPQRSAALYGLIGSLPARGDLRDLVLDMLDQMTRPPMDKGKP